MPVLIASVKTNGTIRKTSLCKRPSTYRRTQDILTELGMDKKAWDKESKLRIMMKGYKTTIAPGFEVRSTLK